MSEETPKPSTLGFGEAVSAAPDLGADGKPLEPTPDPFAGACMWAAELKALHHEPANRKWLLEIPDPAATTRGKKQGVLPLGKCGVLAAGGGTGKTNALCQLALSVATGHPWFGVFEVPEASRGHVVLALAEEDAEEVHRRLYNAGRVMNGNGLTPDECNAAAKRILVLPLAGHDVSFTKADLRGNIERTDTLDCFKERLEKEAARGQFQWRLVVLDPLSRWAGADVEKDNSAATRFVQAVETLLTLPGTPTVLVAHHSSKASTGTGNSDVRGVSGINDGFRWVATLDRATNWIRLNHRKSNYSLHFNEVILVSDPIHGGALQAADTNQKEKYEQSQEHPATEPASSKLGSSSSKKRVDQLAKRL